MNGYTKFIAEMLEVSNEEAMLLQATIDELDLIERWSDATGSQIRRAAKLAKAYLEEGVSALMG